MEFKNLTFGEAVDLLVQGYALQREGWRGV